VLKLLYPRSAVLPFVLLVAMATDVVGVVVVGLQHQPLHDRLGGLPLFGVALAISATLRAGRVRAFWPYLAIAGPLSWLGFYLEGLHPALALVPIVPFLPHEPRTLAFFADASDDNEVHHYEHEWNVAVQIILLLFGLVNAGVLLRHYDTGTFAVLLAALVGRPIGMVAAVGLAVALGLQLPKRMTWRHLMVAAFATSSGFTFALFFATSLFPAGAVANQIKLGALLTATGALLAFGAARVFGQPPGQRALDV
jgi:Na+:H+ antiporter, NhaA family